MNQVMNPVMIADCSCVFFCKAPDTRGHGTRSRTGGKEHQKDTGYKGVAIKVDYDPNQVERSCAWQCNNFQIQ